MSNKNEKNPHPHLTIDPVIFSRKETFHAPSDMEDEIEEDEKIFEKEDKPGDPIHVIPAFQVPSKFQSLMHQTDMHGNQQDIHNHNNNQIYRQENSYYGDDDYNVDNNNYYNDNNNNNNININEKNNNKRTFWDKLCCCFINLKSNNTYLKEDDELPIQNNNINNNYNNNDIIEREETRLPVLGKQPKSERGKKTLVLDLDETLVHSSFQEVENPDYIIPVQIENVTHNVYVMKRPGVDEFLRSLGDLYEVIVYTAGLDKYANPLLDELDKYNVIKARLFREHCVQYRGNYVKDLSLLNRDLSKTIIIDNSPMSYFFHPDNAIDCTSFIDDLTDVEFPAIEKFLKEIINIDDVRGILPQWRKYLPQETRNNLLINNNDNMIINQESNNQI